MNCFRFPDSFDSDFFFLKLEGPTKILRLILQVRAHLSSDAGSLKEACFELERARERL
jgi:hypothetical protein